MPIPLAAISTGLSLVGGLQGLLGGAAKERQAYQARQRALFDIEDQMRKEESEMGSSNNLAIAKYSGQLNDSLQSGGRALGSALAGAGVYDSSATAGALANQGQANTQALTGFSEDLAGTLARLRSGNMSKLMGMKLGYANNDYNNAMEQRSNSASGMGSLLGSLSQFNLMGKGADIGRTTGVAGNGMNNSVLKPVLDYTTMPGMGFPQVPGKKPFPSPTAFGLSSFAG